MSEEDIALVVFLSLLGVYLLIGLFIAWRRINQGLYQSDNGMVVQFIFEVLLWPAALVIDQRP